MSNTEIRMRSVEESRALESRYRAARAEIERGRRIESGQSGALVYAALALNDTFERSPALSRLSHLAQLFCIAALFIVPNLLAIYVLF